jgi:hypothetical protein
VQRKPVQPNRRDGATFKQLASSEDADWKVVSQNFTSWNQLDRWLRELDGIGRAA